MRRPYVDWLDLSPDAYVFPRDAGANEACREAMLAHGTQALAAAVRHAVVDTTDAAAGNEIARRLTAMSLAEALEIGATVHDDWYRTPRASIFARLKRRAAPTDRLSDLAAIEVLDAIVVALRDRRPLGDDVLTLARIAFHGGFNPVCLCPAAYAIGELLTVAAWLGMAHRGRDVVMPEFIATYWLMLLDDLRSVGALPTWEPDAFLIRMADMTFGLEGLREACEATLRTGPVILRRRAVKRIGRARTPAPVPELTVALSS